MRARIKSPQIRQGIIIGVANTHGRTNPEICKPRNGII